MPCHPNVSPTTTTLSASVYSALAERAKARKGRVFALQVGDTWRDPPACARAEAQRSADHPRLHAYAPVVGEPVLLDAIEARLRARHGVAVPRDGLQVMLGATCGLPVVDRLGAPGFDPEAAIARAVGPRTAAIFVNTPNNPTGRDLPPDVVDAI